jgi:hypothetical protein
MAVAVEEFDVSTNFVRDQMCGQRRNVSFSDVDDDFLGWNGELEVHGDQRSVVNLMSERQWRGGDTDIGFALQTSPPSWFASFRQRLRSLRTPVGKGSRAACRWVNVGRTAPTGSEWL